MPSLAGNAFAELGNVFLSLNFEHSVPRNRSIHFEADRVVQCSRQGLEHLSNSNQSFSIQYVSSPRNSGLGVVTRPSSFHAKSNVWVLQALTYRDRSVREVEIVSIARTGATIYIQVAHPTNSARMLPPVSARVQQILWHQR